MSCAQSKPKLRTVSVLIQMLRSWSARKQNASSSTRTILAEPVTRDPFLPGFRGIFQSNEHPLPGAGLGIKQGGRAPASRARHFGTAQCIMERLRIGSVDTFRTRASIFLESETLRTAIPKTVEC